MILLKRYFKLDKADARAFLTLSLAFQLLVFTGCVSQTKTECKLEVIAKHYVIEKFEFQNPKIENIVYDKTRFTVLVWDQPARPGGYIILEISKDMQVVGWKPGR